MKVYNYSPETGEFTGESVADPDPLDSGNYLVPAFAVTTKPPRRRAQHKRVFSGGKWGYQPLPVPAASTPEEAPTETPEMRAVAARQRRNRLLRESDWRVLPDVSVLISEDDRADILLYRQALRTLPDQPGFPDEIVWPELAIK